MPKKSPDVLNYATLKEDAERDVNDHYPTPSWLVERIVTHKNIEQYLVGRSALDLGCGDGVWGQYTRHLFSVLDGVDLRKVENPYYKDPLDFYMKFTNSTRPFVYNNLYSETDFLALDNGGRKYDVIGFNPPFQMLTDKKLQNLFLAKIRSLLNPYGKVVFILQTNYLTGLWRWNNLFSKGLLLALFPFSARIDWTGGGAPRKEHALFILQMERMSIDPLLSEFRGNVIDTKV